MRQRVDVVAAAVAPGVYKPCRFIQNILLCGRVLLVLFFVSQHLGAFQFQLSSPDKAEPNLCIVPRQ